MATAPIDSNTPIHDWFGLTYSSYLAIPRLALEAMPLRWQLQFVELMDDAEAMGLNTPADYEVRRRQNGRFTDDPWRDYRRGDFVAIHGKPLNHK